MKHLFIVLLFTCIALCPLSGDTLDGLGTSTQTSSRFVARINNPTSDSYFRFSNQGFDICSYHPGKHLDLLLNDALYRQLKQEFPSLHVTQTEAQLKANLVSQTKDIPGYRSYQTMVDELMQLQAQYPSLVQVVSIGDSWGAQYAAQQLNAYQSFNHQIWAVKVSDNVQLTEDEPAFYFVGEHHAREPISTETVMGILVHMLEGYGVDPFVTEHINTSEIWFVPLLNPDGHKIVIGQTDVWWRKNLFDNNANHTIDIDNWGNGLDGVDLNRNYGYEWGYISASGDPYSVTYHGTSPFSELETQAFRNLLESRQFIAGISYHSYGQYVLYPFGYMNSIISPDAVEMQALANLMASTIPTQSGTGTYTPMPSYSLYPVSGSSDDWAYGTRGIFAYTIEMAEEFIPPAAVMTNIAQNNITASQILLSRKNSKILKGHVTDAITGEPLVAMIFVEGIDDDPLKTNQSYSDAAYGAYYRFLPEGLHSVKYICPGYITETRNQPIANTGATIDNIALLPAEPLDLQVVINDQAGNALSGATMCFRDAGLPNYVTNEQGIIDIPGFMSGIYRITISYPGYESLQRMESISSPNLIFTLSSSPQLTEGFELDLSAWQVSGNWGRSTSQHYNGSYSLTDSPSGNYPNDLSSTCRLIQPLNLQGVLNANIQFYAKYSIALDGDYCMLSYSTNGNIWKYLAGFTGVSDWQLFSYNLNHLIGNNVYLRFTMSSGSSGNADGIYIDDFMVFTSSIPTSVNEELLPVPAISLSSYPNPFNGKLNININAPKAGIAPLNLSVYNLKGQKVRELLNGSLPRGKHSLVWDGKDGSANACANGIYFIRLTQANQPLKTLKTVLLK
jgi:hypothetical protein